jgi:hypothetical protein
MKMIDEIKSFYNVEFSGWGYFIRGSIVICSFLAALAYFLSKALSVYITINTTDLLWLAGIWVISKLIDKVFPNKG